MSRYKQPYSLYKRGKYWYYRTYNSEGIRTVAKTTGCTSKGAAQKYLDELHLSGALHKTEIVFKSYAAHFFDDDSAYLKDRSKPLSKNSIRIHRHNLNNFIMPYFEKMKLDDITYTKLKNFRVKLLETYAVSNVINIMFTLKTIITTAYKDRKITDNPFNYLDQLQKEVTTIDAFTLEEIKNIYQKLENKDYKNLVLLGALTGMRISEAVGVAPEDIKQGKDFIYIDLKRQFHRGEYIELKGKWGRSFPVIPDVQNMLVRVKTGQANFYKAFIPLERQIKRDNGMKLSFHSLRHYFITQTISSGITESKVNYYTGHRQKGINNVYINYKPEDMLEFLEWQRKVLDYITK